MKQILFILIFFVHSLALGVSIDDDPIEPEQLYNLISLSDRMTVAVNTENGEKTIFESSSPGDLQSFRESLVLMKPKQGEWFHCMCRGNPSIIFFKGTNQTIRLTNHHGTAIRCDLWYSDVTIQDVDKWTEWFDSHGMKFVRNEVEEDKKAKEQWRKQEWDKWHAATPEPIQFLLDSPEQSINTNLPLSLLNETLERGLENQNQRIITLLEWYGSGDGHWSEYPSYEDVAEQLLLMYSTEDILKAIAPIELSPSQAEGCSRLLCGDKFYNVYPDGLNEFPSSLRKQLWRYVVRSKYQVEKRSKACKLVDIPPSKSQGSKLIEGAWVYEENGSSVNFLMDGTMSTEGGKKLPLGLSEDKTWKYICIGRLSFSTSFGSSNYNLLRLNSDYLEILNGSRVVKFKRK